MDYIIDTHILLWFIEGDKRIGKENIEIIESEDNSIFISSASLWEIAIKISIGKLKLSVDFGELEFYLIDKGFEILDFNFLHLKKLINLPFHHQDPFDRMIISQATINDLKIITKDKLFGKYHEN